MEIELKFQLPVSKKKSVLQALNKQNAQKIRLQAKYYDTADRLLAKNHVAIRLRQEGEHWVQTFKAASKNHLQRIEEDIHLGQCEQEPELDLSLYQHNQTVQDILRDILGDDARDLFLQFQTDVERTFHLFEFQGSQIEVCLDDGEIRTPDRQAKICEVEFELKQGSARDLIIFSNHLVEKYQLWLDVRSKAERGNLLAMGKKVSPATKAKTLQLKPAFSAEQAIKLIIENSLNQILPNAAAIADGVAEADHIHQARVGLRRLRSALKHFSHWSAQIDPTWESELAEIFRALGQSRDNDAIQDSVIPLIKEVCDFDFPFNSQTTTNVTKLMGNTKTTQLFLSLLSFTYSENESKTKLKKQVTKSLTKLYQKILKDAAQFSDLPVEQQHRTRKRVKQLRYCIDFISGLYPEKELRQFLSKLQPIQEYLGFYNDLFVAEQIFQQQAAKQSQFLFALGWVKAQQPHVLKKADKKLQSLSAKDIFWE
ncbi:CYTH and CHAD domain-containing protein [Acinetobacter sp. NIPH 2699]|uniref:CYTH and CHAD domain-containing protein n=1 Tax=Acinetobacter sp. NIPH 2699 TaxID=2923433 RepID=UPI001F4B3F86|nr:CYTH and CHAD domain-containing protein [Acinetobacter sp. NIPH 2699]MCH7336896.1 CHAD domain-containing protein [Acinetobacter sp. NIPH 2699]